MELPNPEPINYLSRYQDTRDDVTEKRDETQGAHS
jgi:hypothetical protein